MKTEIEWISPKDKIPPFGTQILVMLGGQGSTDFAKTWERYVRIVNVVIDKTSPNDERPGDVYQDFADDDRDGCFDDYQFYVVDYDKYRFENDGHIESDWFSDAIVQWAMMPDLSFAMEDKKP